MPAASVLETSIAVSDQLHDELLGAGNGEMRSMIGDVLINRIMAMDYLADDELPTLPLGMRNIAREAIDRAVAVDGIHGSNREVFYALFGVEAETPVYAPDEPLEFPDTPQGWPVHGPDTPLFSAA